jgi:molybdopterin molybdotransferase
MDGYAVALDDDSKQFRVVGEIQPGAAPAFKINRGEAARIFTGAQIPEGASQVLMQENVRVEANSITPLQRNRTTHIRRRGEDARTGDLLLKSGSRLGAGELALLASLGVVQPRASALCRIAHFVTGNELVDPAHEPKPGQIRDSNGTLIAALVRAFGGELTRQERVADNFDFLLNKARGVESSFDLLLVSGGASVGDYDFGRRLLTTLGFQIHFEKINLRPGKPLIFATRGNQAAFILPGNPVSHFVVFHVAVRLALELFASTAASWPLAQVQLVDKFDYRPDPRETYWPARVVLEQGKLVARAVRWQSSGDVTGMAGANALLQFTSATQTLEAGSVVNSLLLDVP